MVNIRNFDEAFTALSRFYNVLGTNTYTLDRMRALLEFVGNPQNNLKIVHVAGTSGKTSTAYYAAALLWQSGAHVGMTVSPHVLQISERLQINMMPLPEAEFCDALGAFMDLVEESGTEPSYFELMVAFAFYEFKRRGVDYAVVEVGLGGMLDATNVVSRADKVCIITDIGLDHMHVLGDSLGKIAAQKAGIIQPHNQVFMHQQPTEVMDVISVRSGKQKASLHIIEPEQARACDYRLPLFQQRNFALAHEATEHVLNRDGRQLLNPDELQAAAGTYIPGRMEILQIGGKTVILDGAHNAQKMAALTASLRESYPHLPYATVVAVTHARDDRWQTALKLLAPKAQTVIVTAFELSPDVPKKAIDPHVVADYIRSVSKVPVVIEPRLSQVRQLILQQTEELVVITGSLYLVSALKLFLKEDT